MLRLLKGGYEAFGRGDVPAVLAIFDPNIEWREAEGNPYKPDGKPWIRGDAIVQNLFMRLATEWDGFTVTPNEFYDAGDTIAVACRYTGAYKATGKSIDAQVCHVWKFTNGRATASNSTSIRRRCRKRWERGTRRTWPRRAWHRAGGVEHVSAPLPFSTEPAEGHRSVGQRRCSSGMGFFGLIVA